jgi:predicted nucleic acid-binding protein
MDELRPRPTATIDTSVLLSLQCAKLLGAISVQFDRVLVPSKVRSELEGGGERNRRALAALADYAIFEECSDFSPELVQLLLDTRESLKIGRDRGEAEAVVQASQRRVSMVLSDDRQGRKWAGLHSLECHGTIWVCNELRRSGYLTELRPYYVRLIEQGRRQPLAEMNAFLKDFGEIAIGDEEYRELGQT